MIQTLHALELLREDYLVSAAIRLRPELDLVEAAMLSGVVWRTGACTIGCSCTMERAALDSLPDDLARLRLRLPAGRPFGKDIPPRDCMHLLRRSREPAGRRRHRDVDLLLEFAVWTLRPMIYDWCDAKAECTRVGFGLAAYDIWADSASNTTDAQKRATCWSALRNAATIWLDRRAGRQRTPYAIRLRRASERFFEESEVWKRSSALKAEDILNARAIAETAAYSLLEAALIGSGVPASVRELLLQPPEEPLSGTAEQELIYLARAGRRALRALAARRLAGSEGRQAVATLQQLLWEDYAPLADAALWALRRITPDSAGRIALYVARGMAQDDPSILRSSLLCEAADQPSDGLEQLLDDLVAPEVSALIRREVRLAAQCIRGR